jgi:ribosomal protein L19E
MKGSRAQGMKRARAFRIHFRTIRIDIQKWAYRRCCKMTKQQVYDSTERLRTFMVKPARAIRAGRKSFVADWQQPTQ